MPSPKKTERSSPVIYTPGYLNPSALKPDIDRELKRIADSFRILLGTDVNLQAAIDLINSNGGGNGNGNGGNSGGLTLDDLKKVTWKDITP